MTHIPYGYIIVNGKAVINEKNAERIRTLYKEYVACGSMRAAAKKYSFLPQRAYKTQSFVIK